MSDASAENEPHPVTPRPMPIRILAALAIVAILVFSMWAVIHAATNVKKTVHKDLTLELIPAHALTTSELQDAAGVVRRRAKALGYSATAAVNDGVIDVATDKKPTSKDVATLGTKDTVQNRLIEGTL